MSTSVWKQLQRSIDMENEQVANLEKILEKEKKEYEKNREKSVQLGSKVRELQESWSTKQEREQMRNMRYQSLLLRGHSANQRRVINNLMITINETRRTIKNIENQLEEERKNWDK